MFPFIKTYFYLIICVCVCLIFVCRGSRSPGKGANLWELHFRVVLSPQHRHRKPWASWKSSSAHTLSPTGQQCTHALTHGPQCTHALTHGPQCTHALTHGAAVHTRSHPRASLSPRKTLSNPMQRRAKDSSRFNNKEQEFKRRDPSANKRSIISLQRMYF